MAKRATRRLPGAHSVARYCFGSSVNPDGSLSPAAFTLRDDDDGELSVVSVECSVENDPAISQQDSVRANLSRTLVLGAEARIAELSVKRVRQIRKSRRRLRVEWDRQPDNPCHCAIAVPTTSARLQFDFAVRLSLLANRSTMYLAVR